MSEEARKYLLDILECIGFIQEQTAHIKTFDDYANNKLVKAAAERKLEIIGEALGKALKIKPDLPVSHKQNIIGMRNRIIHAYDEVDDAMVWEVIAKYLPVLKEEVERLMK
jgi:uncharacterized protein with HEPN domain